MMYKGHWKGVRQADNSWLPMLLRARAQKLCYSKSHFDLFLIGNVNKYDFKNQNDLSGWEMVPGREGSMANSTYRGIERTVY